MTLDELETAFELASDEYLKFDRIKKPLHRRPDICAFLMLDDALPCDDKPGHDIVGCAEHDEIWLDVDVEALAAVATNDLIRDLHRCGVRYDASVDSLAMFV